MNFILFIYILLIINIMDNILYIGPQKLCNCDLDDGSWNAEADVVTDKHLLPITQIRFAKLGWVYGNVIFKLSPLICHGQYS